MKIQLLKNVPTEWEPGIYEAEMVEMDCVKITTTKVLYLRPEQFKILPDEPDTCERCLYKHLSHSDGGWCYMFRWAPDIDGFCAQFKRQ
jgi:hypothetical protein